MDNTALKSIRFQGEDPPGFPLDWAGVDLTNKDPYFVLTVKRDKGPAFSMVEPQQPWSWRKFLNRFDDHTLTRIIGPGVTGIFCLPIGPDGILTGASSYDHKREHFAKHGGVRFADAAPVPVWDFVIHRGDGERVRLHPNQTQKKVSVSPFGAPSPQQRMGQRLGGVSVTRLALLGVCWKGLTHELCPPQTVYPPQAVLTPVVTGPRPPPW